MVGVQHCGRDVLGWGAQGDQPDQGPQAAAHAQQLGVGGHDAGDQIDIYQENRVVKTNSLACEIDKISKYNISDHFKSL